MTGIYYSKLYRKSHDKAYRALFDEYCNYVYKVVYSKLFSCGTHEDIEECVSDIFAEIYFKYDPEVEYDGDLKGYIAIVANRRAITKFHRLSSKSNLKEDVDEDEFNKYQSDNDIQIESENDVLSNILIEKIKELGEPDSTIIIQKYYYDRSSNEIARTLSMKASAVRMRCTRALKKLKKKLEDENGIQ